MKSFATFSRSAAQTRSWGRKLGTLLRGGEIIGLTGELGTGKTCFAHGLAEGLEVEKNTWLRSPTFTLINEYHGRLPIYHIDLYRVAAPQEREGLDLPDYLFSAGVAVVEWFQYLAPGEVDESLEVLFEHVSARERRLSFKASGERYERLLEQLNKSRSNRWRDSGSKG
jgi:tRNA threonylcarbamoyladenosine biosynthesis protein TsaE